MKIILNIFLLFLLISCSKDDSPSGTFASTKKILFIGNSHTSRNFGLDHHVKNFADSYEKLNLISRSTQGGYTLEQHLNHASTLTAINQENWDVIILQENTFKALTEPTLMLQSVMDFKNLLSTSRAQVFLYETWAYENSPQDQASITSAYLNASISTGFQVIPIGTKWSQFINSHTISLFEADGIHCNENGTYLIAAIFFKKLFSINNINDASYNGTIDATDAATIREFVSQN